MSDCDPHEELRKYFIIRQGGMGATVNLSGTSNHGNEDRIPMWLMRYCVVGGALLETPVYCRNAVRAKFEALLAKEECDRYCEVASLKRIICKREKTDDSVWVEAKRKANAEARAQDRIRREIEREPAYREGMEHVTMVLPDRMSALLDKDE